MKFVNQNLGKIKNILKKCNFETDYHEERCFCQDKEENKQEVGFVLRFLFSEGIVVLFNQHLGAAYSKRWSKFTF